MNRIEAALHLRKQLATVAKDQISILTPDDVHAQPNADGIDVYLIDADIGSPGGGLRVMSELLSRGVSRHAAFCIYNQASPNLVPATAFDLGANDLVDQRISPSELAVRLHTLVRRKRDADQMRASVQDGLRLAMIDPLTGLHNRRYGMAQLNAIAARSQHDCTEFAVMVVDLDRFKAVNDRWGHAAGDQVLIEVAGRLAATLRASDLLARIGGEEFLIALPATTLVEAGIVAKRLCHAVQTTATVLPDGTAINVTISIGMTVGGRDYMEGTVADLIDKADRALMQSKSGGRNKVTILTQAA